MSTYPVVVVGAGPVGVAVATFIGQRGHRVLLLDRWEGVYPQPRAVHADDEVRRIIELLGVGDEFDAVSRPTLGLRLVDREHRTLAEFERAGVNDHTGYPRAMLFDQPVLEKILRANLPPTVELRGGAEVTSVRQRVGEPVLVDYVEGGSSITVAASYVVGADGANSLVRESIGAMMTHLGFEQRWLVVDIETDAEFGHWDGVHQLCDSTRAETYMRVGPTRHRWEVRLREGESAAQYCTVDRIRVLLRHWLAAAPEAELDLVRVADYTFRAEVADKWREGAVFLAGDAAHLTPPFIGQGLCAGLRDAANLGWKLAGVLDGRLDASVLDSYQAERAPHATVMVRLARLIGQLMTGGGTGGDRIRRLVAPQLAWLPALHKPAHGSSTPRLSASSLIHRSRLDRLAGTLAPELGRESHGTWTLVTTDPAGVLPEALEGRVIRTRSGEPLHAWLGSGRTYSALVRPDSTVAATGAAIPELVAAIVR